MEELPGAESITFGLLVLVTAAAGQQGWRPGGAAHLVGSLASPAGARCLTLPVFSIQLDSVPTFLGQL